MGLGENQENGREGGTSCTHRGGHGGQFKIERKKRLQTEANVLANVVIINRLEVHKATNDGKRAERAIETMEKTHDFIK